MRNRIQDVKPRAARFFVDLIGGELDGERYEITEKGLVVGRSPECDVVLPATQISRQHARFIIHEGYCFVYDLHSRNGIRIRGKRVKRHCLRDGETLDFGYCRMLFNAQGSTRERPSPKEVVQLLENIGELETRKSSAPERAPLDPFAVAAVGFAALACWFWPFAVGALLVAGLAVFEIRRTGARRGMILALAATGAAVVGGGINLYQRVLPTLHFEMRDPLAQQCRQNLGRVHEALSRYSTDHNGMYPRSLQELVPAYVKAEHLICPGALAQGEAGESYRFPGAGRPAPGADQIVLLDASVQNHQGHGGFVLWGDGNAEWVGARKLREILYGLWLR